MRLMTSVFPSWLREDGVRVFQHYLHSHGSFLRPFIIFVFIISHFWQISVMQLSDNCWESCKTVIYQRLSADMKIKYANMHGTFEDLTCIFYHKIRTFVLFYFSETETYSTILTPKVVIRP